MLVQFKGLLEDVNSYEGKNGFGCNVTVSRKIEKRTKRLELRTNDKAIADYLETLLDTQISVVAVLEQNNFGLRFSDIIEVNEFNDDLSPSTY